MISGAEAELFAIYQARTEQYPITKPVKKGSFSCDVCTNSYKEKDMWDIAGGRVCLNCAYHIVDSVVVSRV